MSLDTQMRRCITLFALLPVYITLAAIDIAVWGVLLRYHYAAPLEVRENLMQKVSTRLDTELSRLRVVSLLPNTKLLLNAVDKEGQPLQTTNVVASNDNWPILPRDDIRVRSVLDNALGETLQRLRMNERTLALIFVTDRQGNVVAASERTPLYNYGAADWWKAAFQQRDGVPVSEGLNADNRIGLAVAVRDAGSRSVKGVLRAELGVEQFAAGLLDPGVSNRYGVLLVGERSWLAAGHRSDYGNAAFKLSALYREKGKPEGWYEGVRFKGEPLDSSVQWLQPLWAVLLQREHPIPMDVYGTTAACIVITLCLAIGWTYLVQRWSGGVFGGPYRELLEAGDWILQTAFGRAQALDDLKNKQHVVSLRQQLDGWLHELQQDIREQYAVQTTEMQRDLSLARDFQQAYLDRPYPRIPEVHIDGRLRLDFYHRYQPALALGGDFYNILPLKPDAAGVFIADVMGHGTRSALITAIIRTLIDDLAPQGRNARHFVTEMNKMFCGLLRSVPNPLFASAFYFVADTTARVGTFSSAGHPSPFHLHRSVGRISRLEVPMPRGAALGLMPLETYTGGYCRLVDGDVFVFFTDGVYEAHNMRGEEFGIARMEKVLRGLMYKNAREIVDGMMQAITQFVGDEPVTDDICIIAVEVTTKSPV